MASTASGRGRPAILDKADLDLGNGTNATIRLVGEGDTVQIELPLSWSLDALQRSATRSGGRTKVTFTFDGTVEPVNGAAAITAAAAAPAPAPEVAATNGNAKPRARATKKAAVPEQPASPATKATAPRRSRKKAETATVAA